jgi:23S rRNA pseudouridine1911/1915/1917 synthase
LIERSDVVPEALSGQRLDRVVAIVADLARAEAGEHVDAGAVRVNGAVVTHRSRRLKVGDEVVVQVTLPDAAAGLVGDPTIEVSIVYVDDDVIVIDKPAGLVVHPGSGNQNGTLVHALIARFPELLDMAHGEQAERPGIVHRLDKGTSGLLMVARNPEAVENLIGQLKSRSVSRHYQALAWGRFTSSSGLIDAPVGRSDSDPTRMTVSTHGREARTRYSVLRSFEQPDPCTLVECWLETGRTHQIRVHLTAIGHPVIGDGRYGGSRSNTISSPRPWLHAFSLAFDHPRTGERLSFTSPVPADLEAVLAGLS